MARVLIMDDEEPMRDVMRTILEEDGHDVQEAANGAVGLDMYRAQPADVVVTDLIMPEKDGIETIRDLRREFPNVKIIAISGRGGVGIKANLERARLIGADVAIQKPCGPSEIRDAVRVLAETPTQQKAKSKS